MFKSRILPAVVLGLLVSSQALAQQPRETKTILKGLAPVSALANTEAGQAALKANFRITGGIQNGKISQPTLLAFPQQQQQALRDAFIASGNLAGLADGLGTTLGRVYRAKARYTDRDNFTSVSKPIERVIEYATQIDFIDSDAGKYFFANATTDGDQSVSPQIYNIYDRINGTPDIFGQSYGLPAGSAGADPYGNSRPFQTEPDITEFFGRDYFGRPTTNQAYNRGPITNLIDSPSYPSGHTTYGYTGAVLLAVLVPQRYQQMIARGAEYGNDRIIMGAHYAMDVLGGRTLALYDMAHLLANDPNYMGRTVNNSYAPNQGPVTINDFQATIEKARSSLRRYLESACGDTIEVCANQDNGRLASAATNAKFYDATQTYDLPVVHDEQSANLEEVGKIAPEAGYLLKAAFPTLTLKQANHILTQTQGPGGGFLDNGSAFGVYSRLDLYAAGGMAKAMVARSELTPARHADFKHYTYALTLQPSFCRGNCSEQARNALIGIHGLWASRPQSLIDRGIRAPQWWAKGCDYFHHSERSPELDANTEQRLSELMPSGLLTHEYDKHVQCFGFDTQRFFRTEIRLRDLVAGGPFGRYLKQHVDQSVSHDQVLAAFKNAFDTSHPESLQLRCEQDGDQAVLNQLWITIDAKRLDQFPAAASLINAPIAQDNCPANFKVPGWS